MERHHRSIDRDDYLITNDTRDSRRRESATTSRISGDHQAKKGDQLMPKPDRFRGKLPQEPLAGQLSGDNDYVRRWLVQTDEEVNQQRSDPNVAQKKTASHVELETRVGVGLREPKESFIDVRSRRKRKHHTSSDSSLLEVPVRKGPQPPRRSDLKTEPPAGEKESDRPRKKPKTVVSIAGTSTSSSASPTPKQETFEKRARHKTREGRYEPKKKVKKRSKDGEERSPRKKREKKGDRKKAAKEAGEGLMRNFSSKSIGQERLTIRPSRGLGLFKNGRASSPVQRRGIPDLAFSEMDFLQRSGRHVSVKEDKAISKSREKEKQKVARAQDEISMFLKPDKMPLQPTSLNKGSIASSTHAKDRRSATSDQLDSDYLGRHHERSQSFDFPHKPSLNFRRTKPTLDILSASVGRNPVINRLEYGPHSTSKISGRASTYISWSETQLSREAKSPKLSKVNRIAASSTPESIRRSLEKTGIFRDTGISMPARRAAASPHIYGRSSQRGQTRSTGNPTRSTSTPESGGRVVSPARLGTHELTSSHIVHRPDLREGFHEWHAKDEIAQTGEAEMKRERIVIEHFDPNLGWHEQQRSGEGGQKIATTVTKGEVPEQPKSAPIDRLQRAQMARIKRPPTTVPLPRPSLARDGAIFKNPLNGRMQTNTNVEQEPNQRTSPRNMAEVASQEREVRLNLESGNQSNVRTQRNEHGQSAFLQSDNYKVIGQTVYGGAGTEIQNTPLFLPTKHAEPDNELPSARHEAIYALHSNSSSYLGLPARVFSAGQGPLQNDYGNHGGRPSLQAESEPYYIHQLQRHSASYGPSHHEDHLRRMEYEQLDILTRAETTAELEDFPRSNIPEREGYFYTPADDYIDNVFQHAYEGSEDHGGHLETEPWNLRSPQVDMALEHSEIEELGDSYEEGRLMEIDQRQQLIVRNYTPVEQESGYEQYDPARDGQSREFWQPYPQY